MSTNLIFVLVNLLDDVGEVLSRFLLAWFLLRLRFALVAGDLFGCHLLSLPHMILRKFMMVGLELGFFFRSWSMRKMADGTMNIQQKRTKIETSMLYFVATYTVCESVQRMNRFRNLFFEKFIQIVNILSSW